MSNEVILIITLICALIGFILFWLTDEKMILLATSLLCFVPIFLVDNIFIVIFNIILFLTIIYYVFFSGKEDEI